MPESGFEEHCAGLARGLDLLSEAPSPAPLLSPTAEAARRAGPEQKRVCVAGSGRRGRRLSNTYVHMYVNIYIYIYIYVYTHNALYHIDI